MLNSLKEKSIPTIKIDLHNFSRLSIKSKFLSSESKTFVEILHSLPFSFSLRPSFPKSNLIFSRTNRGKEESRSCRDTDLLAPRRGGVRSGRKNRVVPGRWRPSNKKFEIYAPSVLNTDETPGGGIDKMGVS